MRSPLYRIIRVSFLMAWAVNSPWPAIRDFPTRTRTFILSPYDCSPRQRPDALVAFLRCLLRSHRRWSRLTWDAGASPTFSSITFSTGGLLREYHIEMRTCRTFWRDVLSIGPSSQWGGCHTLLSGVGRVSDVHFTILYAMLMPSSEGARY